MHFNEWMDSDRSYTVRNAMGADDSCAQTQKPRDALNGPIGQLILESNGRSLLIALIQAAFPAPVFF